MTLNGVAAFATGLRVPGDADDEPNGELRVRKLIVLMLPALLALAPLTLAPVSPAAAQTTPKKKVVAKPVAKPKPVAPQQDQSYFDAGPVGPGGNRQDYLGTGGNSGSIPFRGSMVGGNAGAFPSGFGVDTNPAMR